MNLHSFNSNVVLCPKGTPDVWGGKQTIIFPFEKTCDVSWIRQSHVKNKRKQIKKKRTCKQMKWINVAGLF